MFQKGQFIKWTGKDEDGKYSYSGEFQKMIGDTVIFTDANGIDYGIPKDDGTFEKIAKPKGWKKQPLKITVREAPKAAPKKESKKPRAQAGAPTRLDQVVALLQANPALINDRKAAIKKIVADVGMSEAGASTYFSNAKKKLT